VETRSVTAAALIEAHGYWIVAAGCVFEGERALRVQF